MKHYSKWLYSAMAIGMLASCSNDEIIDDNDPVDNGEGVYMHLNIIPNVGNGTRSTTNGEDSSDAGGENGSDIENNVNEVLLVLANKVGNNYEFIADATIGNEKLQPITSGTNKGYATTGKFTKAEIEAYYSSPNFSKKVCVFVFCNPTNSLRDMVEGLTAGNTTWTNEAYELTNGDGAIWSSANNGSFLMSNYRIAERELPATFSAWNPYTVETNPFDLSGMNSQGTANEVDNATGRGVVYVHRAAARFDFNDGSPEETAANTYNVVFDRNADGSLGEALVNVTLTDMALVNLGNKFYYLERTSADGLDAGATLCGPELPWTFNQGTPAPNSGNFVVDAYANAKKSGITSNFGTYFLYPFFDAEGNPASSQWYSSKISDVLAGVSDNYKEKQYKVWRYAIENTIPDADKQMNGQSTGVVFTGKMKATEACNSTTDEGRKALYEAINNVNGILEGANAPLLIQFRGNLYAGIENLYDAAVASAITINGQNVEWNRSSALYRAVFGNGGTGYTVTLVEGGEGKDPVTYTDPTPVEATSVWGLYKNSGNFKAALVANAATIYEASNGSEGWGYYCNYYYWNRHNDNLANGIMGPMEFAVVRNNVYKLAVTKLGQLGHPLIPTNDPDKPTPDTPDEEPNVYMTVTCEVIPWVVRINNIEF